MMDNGTFSGNFYRNGNFEELTVHVENGIIKEIRKFRKGERTINLEGAVLPGFTDIHVHFRDPGETDKEDFITGSMAAAFGGTTTVFDMPNNAVPITDYERFENKKSVIKGRSFVDYGLYSMYNGKNGTIISEESAAIKIYMGGSTNSSGAKIDYEKDEFLKNWKRNIVFHGELEECLKENMVDDVENLRMHNDSRPSRCEKEAMRQVMKVENKNKIVAHLSDYNNINERDNFTLLEMTPHHMLLNYSMKLGALGKVNPPIRSKEIMAGNFQAYMDGKLDILSSDHAPHTEYDKEEFSSAKSGIPGVETRVPLMLALVAEKIVPLNVLVKTAAEKPAEKFGLKKGKIETGYIADFVCVKFSNAVKINEERLHSKNPATPFNGFRAIFPDRVILRGNDIISGKEIIDDRTGSYISSDK